MKMFTSPTSPFVRKVMVVMKEKGITDRFNLHPVNVYDDPAELHACNPLGKIPALILDQGTVLYDSRILTAYLETMSDEVKLVPRDGEAYWRTMRREVMADGIMDAALTIVIEQKRTPEIQLPALIERQLGKIKRGIAILADDVAKDTSSFDLGDIASACALGYLDLRITDFDWRAEYPELASWYETISARPSMIETVPQG